MQNETPKLARDAAINLLSAIASERDFEREWLDEQINNSKNVLAALREYKDIEAAAIQDEMDGRMAAVKAEGAKRIAAMENLFNQLQENERARVEAYAARKAVINYEETHTKDREALAVKAVTASADETDAAPSSADNQPTEK
jgi:hypothetical protein